MSLSSNLFDDVGWQLRHAAHFSSAYADEVANAHTHRLRGRRPVNVSGREHRCTLSDQFWIFEQGDQILKIDELPFGRQDGSGFFQVSVYRFRRWGLVGAESANDSVPLPGITPIPSLVITLAMARRHFSAVG